MFIQIEETPNPNTLKFLPGIEIMPPGQTASFRSEQDCKNSKLAKKIIEIDGVESVFFGSEFISITKADSINWQSLKAIIVATIVDHTVAGIPIIEAYEKKPIEHLSIDQEDIVRQIIEVIDEKVRPAVAQDGGDIVFHSYKDGVVYVEMQGACSGCPSATLTLKDGIENMLQYYIPEVIRVEQI
jgi:Fe-S cluster biogenesis protein NfuA